MTIEKFNSAVRNDGSCTVRVIDHKTDYMGPADIVFNAKLYDTQYFRNSLTVVSTDKSSILFKAGWVVKWTRRWYARNS